MVANGILWVQIQGDIQLLNNFLIDVLHHRQFRRHVLQLDERKSVPFVQTGHPLRWLNLQCLLEVWNCLI